MKSAKQPDAEYFTSNGERVPLPVEELERLAKYYDEHDTSDEMDEGLEWVDPRPMVAVSLRIPSDLRDALKRMAKESGVRYTTFVRQILEKAVNQAEDPSPEFGDSGTSDVESRLDSVEAKLDLLLQRTRQDTPSGPFQALVEFTSKQSASGRAVDIFSKESGAQDSLRARYTQSWLKELRRQREERNSYVFKARPTHTFSPTPLNFSDLHFSENAIRALYSGSDTSVDKADT